MIKRRREDHINHERWLVSYADLVTLLFALFVILYAISKTDHEKLKAVGDGLGQAFGTREPGQAKSSGGKSSSSEQDNGPGDESEKTSKNATKSEQEKVHETPGEQIQAQSQNPASLTSQDLSTELAKNLAKEVEGKFKADFGSDPLFKQLEITSNDRGVIVRMSAQDFYDKGEAKVRAGALNVVDQMAKTLATLVKENGRRIRVEGHTDNAKTSSDYFPSNWELSTARAAWFVRYLIQKWQFEPRLLEASGYADTHPLAPNDTEEGRARNRRVEIVIFQN